MTRRRRSPIHRSQALVLGFFALAWLGLASILVAAPEIYGQALEIQSVAPHVAELAFFGAVTVLLVILGIGVIRRWRWMFWMVLVAFLAGGLRVPTAILDLTGVYSTGGPAWYAVMQGVVGVVQLALGMLLLISYRRRGIWG